MTVKTRLVATAFATVLALGGGLTSAMSETYVERVTVSRYVACYDRVYVPARVLVNTRGRLVRGERVGWETSPTRWDRIREPATYIQTRRTIEPDHYTLVRRGC